MKLPLVEQSKRWKIFWSNVVSSGNPCKRVLYQPGWEWKVMVVDVGEMEIERPKKKQKRYYSGKQHCHTIKAQLLVEFETGQVVCTAIDKGRVHDFKLLGCSSLPFLPSQLCLADKGYQGFGKRHKGACIPTKKPRNQSLPEAEKQHNRALARLRVRALTRHPSLQDFSPLFWAKRVIVESALACV
jgi:hypothetical protein